MRQLIRYLLALFCMFFVIQYAEGHEVRVQSSVCGTWQTYTVDDGALLTVVATADEGAHFVQWEDGSTENPRTIEVTSDRILSATFAANGGELPDKKTIQFCSGECTTPLIGEFVVGATLRLEAMPIEGYKFKQWSDGNTSNPRNLIVTDDATYCAEFETYNTSMVTYRTVIVQTNTCTTPLVERIPNGATLTLIAQQTDSICDMFEKWEDNSTNPKRVMTISDDTTFIANFGTIKYIIDTKSADESQGTVSVEK
jgi:hypothetical protein